MCRKSTSIIVIVCLLALSSFALGGQLRWTATGGTDDWFTAGNWEDGAGSVPTIGDRACIEAKAPTPVLAADACCQSLEINPWMWEFGPADCNFTINAGHFDANCISLGGTSLQYANPGWSATPGLLTVNGGLVTIHDDVNAAPDENAPPAPGYGGRGLWIGGGSTTWWLNYSNVVVNGGYVKTPKIAIYNGDLTINGGTVYDTCGTDVPTQLIIRDNWPRNKIYINGGTLGLKGDRVAELNAYITARRIVGVRGALIGPTYNAGATPEPNTTLTSDVNIAAAWDPSPEHLMTNVHFHTNAPAGITLSWKAGDWIGDGQANAHYVYLGTVFADISSVGVGTAGTATPIFRGVVNQSADDTNDPNLFIAEGALLVQNKTYYWRVDEVNDTCATSPWKGPVWQFKTVNEKASNPKPANIVGGLRMPLQLTWTPGDWSPVDHHVYFGTTLALADAINDRGTVSSTVYPLSKLLEDLVAPAGPDWVLAPNTTYYWRIDEKNSAGAYGPSSKGDTWSFNTGGSISIEDFQAYEATTDLNQVWLEGAPVCGGQGGTGRVALIREGQSGKYMQFTYDKSGGTDADVRKYFSEVDLPYSDVDWVPAVLASPVKLLEIKYRGAATNSVDPLYDRMYVAVEDTGGDVNIVLHPLADAQTVGPWTTWAIAYNEMGSGLAGQADLNHVSDLYLGAGSRCNAFNFGGGEGNIMFDDIRVLASTCVPAVGPVADFDGNCLVDLRDLDIMANDWLAKDEDYDWTASQAAPQAPILWYDFNETTGTSVADTGTGDTNDYTGSVTNYNASLTWDTDGGRAFPSTNSNGCIYLPAGSQNSYVVAPTVSTGTLNFLYFMDSNSALPPLNYPYTGNMSFSIWANADMTAADEFGGWSGIFGVQNAGNTVEKLEIHCPSPWTGGNAAFGPGCNFIKRQEAGYAGDGATASTGKRPMGDFGGRWNNWIFVQSGPDAFDVNHLTVYLNGVQVADTNSTTDADVAGPLFHAPFGEFRVGTRGGNWGMYAGRLDDFKVFDYPLTENEVHYIATDGTGVLHVEVASDANIKHDTPQDIVNFGDLALMVDEWMTEKLWP